VKPTPELALQRIHPEDVRMVQQTTEGISSNGGDFDLEHRLLMPNGSVKTVRFVGHSIEDPAGGSSFLGALRP